MKLARLRTFVNELLADNEVRSSGAVLSVYRFYDGCWFDTYDKQLQEPSMIASLNGARTSPTPTHQKKSRSCYYPVSLLDAVVMATFDVSPQKPKRDRMTETLARCLEHSTNAFAAGHDGLTGVLNKTALERHLEQTLESAMTPPEVSPDAVGPVTVPETIAAIALDIDHFKQLNDTHGHLYGDIVLSCFAARLEHVVTKLQKSHTGSSLVLGRTGGEEFVIVCSGKLHDEDVLQLAETLRLAIADEPLPSEADWAGHLGQPHAGSIKLPHTSERRVTTSVGVGSISPRAVRGDAKTLAVRLLAHADTALYRAKAGGRNIVRRFSDILAKHGRILEHHPETEVVAIDIGTQVNVAQGQEFLVFHPQFTGTTDFVFTDGRTRKRIGSYPRMSYGRIVAFNVQAELSFCRILENRSGSAFAVGSFLEAVPVGAISHILAGESGFGALGTPDVSKPDELVAFIKNTADGDRWPSVCVLSIANLTELLRERGTAYVNHALAKLYGVAHSHFQTTFRIGQVNTTEIAVVGAGVNRKGMQARAEAVISESAMQCGGIPQFTAGIFAEPETDELANVDRKRALELARYAVSPVGRQEQSVTSFSVIVAINVLANQRVSGLYSNALADYRTFWEAGLRNAAIENLAAICAVEGDTGELDFARDAFSRAIEMDASVAIYKANLAIVLFRLNMRRQAYEQFLVLQSTHRNFVLPDNYMGPFALSALAALQDHHPGLKADDVRQLLARAAKIPAEKQHWVDPSELQAAVNSRAAL
jgi:diguanylate cyclase (GGDEF)-like protein